MRKCERRTRLLGKCCEKDRQILISLGFEEVDFEVQVKRQPSSRDADTNAYI